MFLPTCILEMLNIKGSRYNESAIKGLKVLRQAHKKKMYNKHNNVDTIFSLLKSVPSNHYSNS